MPRLLVLGGAACVFEDAARAQDLGTFDAVMAINDAIAKWPGPIDYAVTLHPEKFGGWFRAREHAGFPGRPVRWAHKLNPAGRVDLPPERATDDWAGSSTLLGVKIGLLEEGFARIVVAGAPMDGGPHVGAPADDRWVDFGTFRPAWVRRREQLLPFVRSMSGWTAALLGEPTTDWLADHMAPSGPQRRSSR